MNRKYLPFIGAACVLAVIAVILAIVLGRVDLFTPNRDLVLCAGYSSIALNGLDVSMGPATEREFLFSGQQLRIRQDGDIQKVRLAIKDLTELTGVYITIWRRHDPKYSRIGESENLLPLLKPNSINDVILTTPIENAMEGDFYGIRVTSAVESNATRFVMDGDIENAVTYWFDSNPGDVDVDWENGYQGRTKAGNAIPVQLFMQAPVIVAIGDSIVAGYPNNNSFIEENRNENIEESFPYKVRTALDVTLQNMSIGTNSIGEIQSRFGRDCVDLKPRIAIIEAGLRDIRRETPKSEYMESWQKILTACVENKIIAVVLGIPPWNSSTNDEMETRDDWNIALSELVGSFDGFIYIDPNPYVGKSREEGPEGNLWDIKDDFDADGLNYTEAGYEKIAGAITAKIIGLKR